MDINLIKSQFPIFSKIHSELEHELKSVPELSEKMQSIERTKPAEQIEDKIECPRFQAIS